MVLVTKYRTRPGKRDELFQLFDRLLANRRTLGRDVVMWCDSTTERDASFLFEYWSDATSFAAARRDVVVRRVRRGGRRPRRDGTDHDGDRSPLRGRESGPSRSADRELRRPVTPRQAHLRRDGPARDGRPGTPHRREPVDRQPGDDADGDEVDGAEDDDVAVA